MRKDDAINIINGSNLVGKSGVLYIFFCLLCIKMSESTDLNYYQEKKRHNTK